MSLESLEQRIEKQQERLKQLKAQKQKIENKEKSRRKELDRKDDVRRKILLGALTLKKMEDETETTKILAELNEYLTEDRDRKLFNL